jgi:hypothetical protein
MKYLRLKNQKGCFTDPETRLVLTGDDVAPYILPVGRITRSWVNSGGLVLFEVSDEPAKEVFKSPKETTVEPKIEINLDTPGDEQLAYRFYTKEEAESMGYWTLQKAVAAFGAKPKKTDNKQMLIKLLMDKQEEIKAQL